MNGTIGPLSAGNYQASSFQVLCSNVGAFYKVGGVTIDMSSVTPEAASRTLAGGYVTTIGERVIEAGYTIQKNGSGNWVVATDQTTLVPGECYVLDKHLTHGGSGLFVFGAVIDNGTVFKARIKVGGAGQPTLANFRAAFPRITLQSD